MSFPVSGPMGSVPWSVLGGVVYPGVCVRKTLLVGRHPSSPSPRSRHTPPEVSTSLSRQTPPRFWHLMAGTAVVGKHPTGKHSCLLGVPPYLDMFKLVHYVALTVGKRPVGIRLKCLLIFFCSNRTGYSSLRWQRGQHTGHRRQHSRHFHIQRWVPVYTERYGSFIPERKRRRLDGFIENALECLC